MRSHDVKTTSIRVCQNQNSRLEKNLRIEPGKYVMNIFKFVYFPRSNLHYPINSFIVDFEEK